VINLSPASVVLEIDPFDPSRVIVEGVQLTAGNLFILTVTGVKDTQGNTIPNDGINNRFKGTVQGDTPPRIVTANFFTTAPHVELTFNKPLDVNSARNPFNYSVRATDNSEFPDVIDATYDGTTVKLTLDSDLTAGKEYEVIAGVVDLAGNFGFSIATGTAGTRAARVRSLR
jgi:predicted phage tail protein